MPLSPTEPGERNFGIRETAKQIGLPVSAVKLLRQSGHFEVRHKTFHVATFHERDIAAFVAKINGLQRQSLASPADLISIGQAMGLHLKFFNGKGELIAAILDGEIPVLGSQGPGVPDLLVSRKLVNDFVSNARSMAFSETLTPAEVALELLCDPLAVAALIDRGHIEGRRHVAGWRVTAKSVMNFKAKYRSVASLAQMHGKLSRALIRRMNEVGIEMLKVDRSNSNIQQPFIAVADIPRLAQEVLPTLASPDRNAVRPPTALERLNMYLADLQKNSLLLPRRGGKPKVMAIADACGFERSSFYKNQAIKDRLDEFDMEEPISFKMRGPIPALEGYLAKLKKQGHTLPMRGVHPNLKMIALMSGFDRNSFYVNPTLGERLGDFLNPRDSTVDGLDSHSSVG